MKVLITGKKGQLAQELILNAPKEFDIITTSRDQLNLNSKDECIEAIKRYKPDWLINCAAYTNVDKAEIEYENALSINSLAPREFALQLKKSGGKLLQISTDYVFNGNQNEPYKTFQDCKPLNKYGISKLKGEEYIKNILFNSDQGIILRTSWLMGPTGKNFISTILKLISKKQSLRIISDQYSSPTSTFTLSNACWRIINEFEIRIKKNIKIQNIFHWSDAGVASWYDVAIAIQEIGLKYNLIENEVVIDPIHTSEYKSLAERPKFSVLDCESTSEFIKYKQIHWRKALEETLKKIT